MHVTFKFEKFQPCKDEFIPGYDKTGHEECIGVRNNTPITSVEPIQICSCICHLQMLEAEDVLKMFKSFLDALLSVE